MARPVIGSLPEKDSQNLPTPRLARAHEPTLGSEAFFNGEQRAADQGGRAQVAAGLRAEDSGKDGLQQVLAALPDGDQRTLKMLFTSNWYPFELGKTLDDAIVRVLGGGRPEFFERLGAASAEKNLSAVHSGYLTKGDPHGFLAKSPSFYSLYYETGRREYTPVGTQGGRVHHLRRRDVQRARLPHRGGVVPEGARDVRRPGVKIVEEECRAKGGKVCRYRVKWD